MGDIRQRGLIAATAAAMALSPFAARIVAADGLAVDDAYAVAEDGALIVAVETGVLANDTGGSLVLCVSSFDTSGLQGALTEPPGVAADGSFTYTPPPNFNGTTSFTYDVATTIAGVCPPPPTGEGTATVTITVTPVNDAPAAVADSFTALKDRTLNVAAPGVLANDSDIDGDPLTADRTSSPSHGVVNLSGDGSFSYTPDAGYVGSDAFSYRATDGTANSPQRLVTLTIVAVPPTRAPTPIPTQPPAPTAVPEPSPTESPLPSDSGLPSPSPVDTGAFGSPSPSAGPVVGPLADGGGPPIVAIAALVLLAGLLGVAAWYFARSQRTDDEEADETAGSGPEGAELDGDELD